MSSGWCKINFAPFAYALTLHGEKPFGAALHGAFGYVAGTIAYVAIPLIIVFAAARPNRAVLAT